MIFKNVTSNVAIHTALGQASFTTRKRILIEIELNLHLDLDCITLVRIRNNKQKKLEPSYTQ